MKKILLLLVTILCINGMQSLYAMHRCGVRISAARSQEVRRGSASPHLRSRILLLTGGLAGVGSAALVVYTCLREKRESDSNQGLLRRDGADVKGIREKK